MLVSAPLGRRLNQVSHEYIPVHTHTQKHANWYIPCPSIHSVIHCSNTMYVCVSTAARVCPSVHPSAFTILSAPFPTSLHNRRHPTNQHSEWLCCPANRRTGQLTCGTTNETMTKNNYLIFLILYQISKINFPYNSILASFGCSVVTMWLSDALTAGNIVL